MRILERLVLDPAEVKGRCRARPLGPCHRRAHVDHDHERAMVALVRALRPARNGSYQSDKIKSWDVQLEQLPESMRDLPTCYLEMSMANTSCRSRVSGAPWPDLGDQMGYGVSPRRLRMKPLLDGGEPRRRWVMGSEAIKANGCSTIRCGDEAHGVSESAAEVFRVPQSLDDRRSCLRIRWARCPMSRLVLC